MPYFTGSASGSSDLLTKIRTHLTSDLSVPEQWVLNGDVLSRGGCFVRITAEVDGGLLEYLNILGGTGVDGGNQLTGVPILHDTYDRSCSLGPVGSPSGFQFPIVYFLHVFTSPDEVMLVIRDDSTRYSHLQFGQSNIASALPGSGNWFGAQLSRNRSSSPFWYSDITVVTDGFFDALMFGFWQASGGIREDIGGASGIINHGLDGIDWSCVSAIAPGDPNSGSNPSLSESAAFMYESIIPLITKTPNLYNDQAILFNTTVCVHRPDAKISIVADFKNIRIMKMDNYQPEDILTIGSDKWAIYPLTKKNASLPNGEQGSEHSGTVAYAIRYDGP